VLLPRTKPPRPSGRGGYGCRELCRELLVWSHYSGMANACPWRVSVRRAGHQFKTLFPFKGTNTFWAEARERSQEDISPATTSVYLALHHSTKFKVPRASQGVCGYSPSVPPHLIQPSPSLWTLRAQTTESGVNSHQMVDLHRLDAPPPPAEQQPAQNAVGSRFAA
jgi:hypothetical protein